MSRDFKDFQEFYPFYIGEHSLPLTRIFHFVGTGCFLGLSVMSLIEKRAELFVLGPCVAYAFAWFSHFFIEKNRPATFKYPLYSLRGDFKMFIELLFFKRRFF
jgi:hypothetical protein